MHPPTLDGSKAADTVSVGVPTGPTPEPAPLVGRRHGHQRRARSRSRCLQQVEPARDCRIASAIGRAKPPTQGLAFSFRDVDAQFLHQSCGAAPLGGAAPHSRAGKRRASSDVFLARSRGPTPEPGPADGLSSRSDRRLRPRPLRGPVPLARAAPDPTPPEHLPGRTRISPPQPAPRRRSCRRLAP